MATEFNNEEFDSEILDDILNEELNNGSLEDIDEDQSQIKLEEGRRKDYKIILKALFLSALVGFTAYTIIKESKVGKIRILPKNLEYSTSDENEHLLDNDGICYDCENSSETPNNMDATCEAYHNIELESKKMYASDVADKDFAENVDASSKKCHDEFENIVTEFSNKNDKALASVSISDITKFVAIANIDYIVENDAELSKNLFSEPSKEEYLNDAAKVIGAVVMYDYNIWSETNSSEGFIKISDIIMGSQRDEMIKIENYVDRIADAQNNQDSELVNKLVSEFLEDMNTGELSKLDDGVGFASEVHIALIADVIARNNLDQSNFDMLQILKSSEKYVSNIFAVYDKCKNESKILSR